jgi:hypothetical protein
LYLIRTRRTSDFKLASLYPMISYRTNIPHY